MEALQLEAAAHESFRDKRFFDLCRARNIAIVFEDSHDYPCIEATTADFTYARLQGAPGSDHYEPSDLELWAKRVDAQSSGKPVPGAKLIAKAADKPRDVFALFVSTDKEHAPQNAQNVMKRLGISPST